MAPASSEFFYTLATVTSSSAVQKQLTGVCFVFVPCGCPAPLSDGKKSSNFLKGRLIGCLHLVLPRQRLCLTATHSVWWSTRLIHLNLSPALLLCSARQIFTVIYVCVQVKVLLSVEFISKCPLLVCPSLHARVCIHEF